MSESPPSREKYRLESQYEKVSLLLEHKSFEMAKLRNRILRYRRRLLTEAIGRGRDEGIRIEIWDDDGLETACVPPCSDTIAPPLRETVVVHTISDEECDFDPVMELAKPGFPSLHRRYYAAKQKYEREIANLELIYQSHEELEKTLGLSDDEKEQGRDNEG